MNQHLKEYDVIVIGGGAAGLMASATVAEAGFECLLLEKNNTTGKKILITGKGRCNITNACDTEDLFGNIRRNPRFMYSAIYSFTNFAVIDFFNGLGVKTKVERGNRVFPVSDKAADVADALFRNAEKAGVRIRTGCSVSEIITEKGRVTGVRCGSTLYKAKKVITACGGASYPATGSDGSGFRLAEKIGHGIITPRASLTGLNTKQGWPREAMGLTLRNVLLRLYRKSKEIYSGQGELLLAHFGITGPIVLTGSAALTDTGCEDIKATIDLKPALSEEKLDKRLIRDFDEFSRKQFSNSLDKLLPSGMIPIIIRLSGIPDDKKVNQITQKERQHLVNTLKNLELDITGTRPLKEAIVTAGGVDVREINPSTMESRKVSGLYFCGEMIDVDANTGGFNLQIAFSTGRLAGISCAEAL